MPALAPVRAAGLAVVRLSRPFHLDRDTRYGNPPVRGCRMIDDIDELADAIERRARAEAELVAALLAHPSAGLAEATAYGVDLGAIKSPVASAAFGAAMVKDHIGAFTGDADVDRDRVVDLAELYLRRVNEWGPHARAELKALAGSWFCFQPGFVHRWAEAVNLARAAFELFEQAESLRRQGLAMMAEVNP